MNAIRFYPRRSCPAIYAAAVVAAMLFGQSARAVDGTWNTTTTGALWGLNTNWVGSTIATGSDSTAFFNALDITAATTVNLDSARTIGTLVFSDTDTTTAGSWTLANSGTAANVLTLGGAATITTDAMASVAGTTSNVIISAIIDGTNGLTKDGSGTNSASTTSSANSTGSLTLSAANTYTGATNINAGTLRVTNASAFGGVAGGKITTNVVTVANGARLILSSVTIANTINLNGSNALSVTGGSGGTLSGTVNLQSNSSAWVTNVSGNNTLTFSAAGTLNLSNYVLSIAGAGSANTTTIAGILTGGATSGITQNGGAAITISADGSGYAGTTTLAGAGPLQLGSDTALGSSGTLALNPANNQSVTIRSSNATDRSIAVAVTVNSGIGTTYNFGSNTTGNLTFSNTTDIALLSSRNFAVLNGQTRFDAGFTGVGGGITKSGTGTLLLNGTNTYTGATTINAGTVQLGNGGTTGSLSDTTVISGSAAGTLAFDRSDAMTVSNNIGGSVAVTQIGSGTTTLSGTSTYTGATSVKAGVLNVTGSLSGSSAVTVGDSTSPGTSAILGGSGTVGNVTVGATAGNTGAHIAPGMASTIGNLTTGSLTFADNSAHLDIRLGQTISGNPIAGTNNDAVTATGNVTLAGADLALTLGGGFNVSGDGLYFIIINNSGQSGGTGNLGQLSFDGNALAQDGTFTLGSQQFAISYNADFATRTFDGTGNDVALMAIPEPGTWGMILSGFGMLIGFQKLRRRRVRI